MGVTVVRTESETAMRLEDFLARDLDRAIKPSTKALESHGHSTGSEFGVSLACRRFPLQVRAKFRWSDYYQHNSEAVLNGKQSGDKSRALQIWLV